MRRRISMNNRQSKIALFAMALLCVVLAGHVRANEIEVPPTVSASTLPASLARGTNFRVEEQIPSDGFVRFYTLTTNYGRFEVQGIEMLKVRVGELQALAALSRMNESEVYVNAAAKAGIAPLQFAGNLVLNPVGTIGQTLSGVGTAFSRVAQAGEDPGSARDRYATDSAFGVSAAKRQIAGRLGVDPYTDFKPLADKLDEMARITVAGSLTVSAAFMAIPGGAGMAVSGSRSANDLGQLSVDKTPIEVRNANRAKLAQMGVSDAISARFLGNRTYTPYDQTIIVNALSQMNGVRNRQVYIERAADIVGRDMVFFLRKRAEMTAEYHNRTEPFAEFISASGVPMAVTRSRRVVAILPLDGLAWTETTQRAVRAISRDLKSKQLDGDVEIRISGVTTDSVRRGVRANKWKIVENAER